MLCSNLLRGEIELRKYILVNLNRAVLVCKEGYDSEVTEIDLQRDNFQMTEEEVIREYANMTKSFPEVKYRIIDLTTGEVVRVKQVTQYVLVP